MDIIETIGDMIVEAKDDPRTAETIREMHKTQWGAELLRKVVRNGGPASDIIANSLWRNLG